MDLDRLYKILDATTAVFRKGPAIDDKDGGPMRVTQIYDMPPVYDAPDGIVKVDVEFMVVGVDRALAKQHEDDLKAVLAQYPDPDELLGGPSYITVGAVVGSQDAALRLYALGDVLGLWTLITPTKMHFSPAQCMKLAGTGFIMITGWNIKKYLAEKST